MTITTFTNKMTKVRDWDSHFMFFDELEGCRDGMYAIKLQSMSIELMQTQWEQLWVKVYIQKDTAYLSLLTQAVYAAREDQQDGGPKVIIPLNCPKNAPLQCQDFLGRVLDKE